MLVRRVVSIYILTVNISYLEESHYSYFWLSTATIKYLIIADIRGEASLIAQLNYCCTIDPGINLLCTLVYHLYHCSLGTALLRPTCKLSARIDLSSSVRLLLNGRCA